jgi:hypothetical protein
MEWWQWIWLISAYAFIWGIFNKILDVARNTAGIVSALSRIEDELKRHRANAND